MGGLTIKVQSFGLYQAIEWLSSSESISNQVNAARRIRKMADNGKAEDLMKLNVVSRLVERLEKTETLVVQVAKIFLAIQIPFQNLTSSVGNRAHLVQYRCWNFPSH